jgi:L-fuculose-phosphate aldolase
MSCKKDIIKTMKKLYKKELISVRDGNVSFKPKNEDCFYISAGSVKKHLMSEDQVIKVNFDKMKNLSYDKSFRYQPSREIFMHSFLHTHNKNYDKNNFVVHAHPKNIISFMGVNQSQELNNIKTFFPEINVGSIGKNVLYHDAGSLDLAKNCYDNLLNHEIVGLERHGSLSVGSDIDRIFENIETLEYYIECYLKSK